MTLRASHLALLGGSAALMLLGGFAFAMALRAPPPSVTAIEAVMPPAEPMTKATRIRFPPGEASQLVLPDGRRETVRSMLNIGAAMRYGDYVWDEAGVPDGPLWIRVDLSRQMLSVFRAGHEIGAAVILYGVGNNPTPTGIFPILAKARVHRSSLYEADMPYMQRLTGDGIAIHGTEVRGGFASRGCIGVPVAFARKLFGVTHLADRVVILPEKHP